MARKAFADNGRIVEMRRAVLRSNERPPPHRQQHTDRQHAARGNEQASISLASHDPISLPIATDVAITAASWIEECVR